jgi:two-component sensor histidine kinase
MTTAPERNPHGRARPQGVNPPGGKAWSGLGPIRSIRGGLLLMTIVAVTPLVLFASTMALLRAGDANRLPTAAAWLTVAAVPVLIGVAAVVIVGIASEAMVMEWLFYLERLSRAYARGRYSLRPKRLHQAPLEFRSLGEAVEEMAAAVEHRDQALRDALQEQTVLLREVHHRVKNNLQIVGSLLSLQAARSRDPNTREALQDAMVRIDAMSLSQRFMQQQEEEEDNVLSVDLFEAFMVQVRARMGGGPRGLDLTSDVEPRVLPLLTGSRLILVAAEAVICAFRGSTANPLVCRLTVRFTDDTVRMELSVEGEPDAFACTPDGVSRDLIGGYVRQLRGSLEVRPGGGALSVAASCTPLGQPPDEAPRSAAVDVGQTQAPKFFRLLHRTHNRLAS